MDLFASLFMKTKAARDSSELTKIDMSTGTYREYSIYYIISFNLLLGEVVSIMYPEF
ncbi:hypothetical protein THMIRHAS_24450 [Thiosulfatimonas sediminis]|uniref:Uncharacterized protein n=1 Tax=Thiosulfatimonas sediminis TaxID=2675054 RepID=A0A6F8PY47_9GAMM|nr:hypothetical protein THMIRHAS_24450 [Thiosulfatimonas sediminis]